MKLFLREGDIGDLVNMAQCELKSQGFYKSSVDGVFGLMTLAAVMSFQVANKLNADGVIGPITWAALTLVEQELPKRTAPPDGVKGITRLFGDPLESGYWKAYSGFCETPKELDRVFPYKFEDKNGFWCNKLLTRKFQLVYQDIVDKGLSHMLHTFDGCYNCRYIRGKRKLSTHAWAIAVDHNAETNPLGAKGDMSLGIIYAFERQGFLNGGRWRRKDFQHFQYAFNY